MSLVSAHRQLLVADAPLARAARARRGSGFLSRRRLHRWHGVGSCSGEVCDALLDLLLEGGQC